MSVPTKLHYPDSFLAKFCTIEREDRAFAHVDELDTFAEPYRSNLARYYCYILVCLENQANADDLFSVKYKAYSKEYEGYLTKARASIVNTEGLSSPIFSIPMERA